MRCRVLVVEDDAGVRALCEQTLADEGYEVVTAASAEEALALLHPVDDTHDPAATAPELHLAIMDLSLPGMSGTALARRLAADHPDVAIMFTSGYDPAEFDLGVPGGGSSFPRRLSFQPTADAPGVAVAFLPKPFGPEELLDAARPALPAGCGGGGAVAPTLLGTLGWHRVSGPVGAAARSAWRSVSAPFGAMTAAGGRLVPWRLVAVAARRHRGVDPGCRLLRRRGATGGRGRR